MDATIVATHMMLEATNIGVDNIWVRMFDREKVKEVFNLKENIIPICIMPLGYIKEECQTSSMHNLRKNLNETVEYI